MLGVMDFMFGNHTTDEWLSDVGHYESPREIQA
jgi:hypothetical protein